MVKAGLLLLLCKKSDNVLWFLKFRDKAMKKTITMLSFSVILPLLAMQQTRYPLPRLFSLPQHSKLPQQLPAIYKQTILPFKSPQQALQLQQPSFFKEIHSTSDIIKEIPIRDKQGVVQQKFYVPLTTNFIFITDDINPSVLLDIYKKSKIYFPSHATKDPETAHQINKQLESLQKKLLSLPKGGGYIKFNILFNEYQQAKDPKKQEELKNSMRKLILQYGSYLFDSTRYFIKRDIISTLGSKTFIPKRQAKLMPNYIIDFLLEYEEYVPLKLLLNVFKNVQNPLYLIKKSKKLKEYFKYTSDNKELEDTIVTMLTNNPSLFFEDGFLELYANATFSTKINLVLRVLQLDSSQEKTVLVKQLYKKAISLKNWSDVHILLDELHILLPEEEFKEEIAFLINEIYSKALSSRAEDDINQKITLVTYIAEQYPIYISETITNNATKTFVHALEKEIKDLSSSRWHENLYKYEGEKGLYPVVQTKPFVYKLAIKPFVNLTTQQKNKLYELLEAKINRLEKQKHLSSASYEIPFIGVTYYAQPTRKDFLNEDIAVLKNYKNLLEQLDLLKKPISLFKPQSIKFFEKYPPKKIPQQPVPEETDYSLD